MRRRAVLRQASGGAATAVSYLVGLGGLVGCATPTPPKLSLPPATLIEQARQIAMREWMRHVPPEIAVERLPDRARLHYPFTISTLMSHPSSIRVEMLCLSDSGWLAEETYLAMHWQNLGDSQRRLIGPMSASLLRADRG